MLKYLWISVLVLAVDLASKLWISQTFQLHESLTIIPQWFNLYLAHNPGAAFSFLANESGWQRWFFALIATIICFVLVVWIKRLPAHEKWMAIALGLVLGGALANLWDRLTLGYVVDFLDFYYTTSVGREFHWPAFNVADMAISSGAVMLIIDVLFSKDKLERS